jgi:hypothetical protein
VTAISCELEGRSTPVSASEAWPFDSSISSIVTVFCRWSFRSALSERMDSYMPTRTPASGLWEFGDVLCSRSSDVSC